MITVTPTVAPNAFGSPSYAGWVTNSIAAQHDGLSALGNPASPTFYQAQSNVNPSQVIVTSFPSWLGQQDPGTVFGPAFTNELGNRMLFGLKVDGEGAQFSISQLSFNAVSDDPGDGLGFGFGAGSYNYSSDYEGVLKGSDGLLWTADDIFITSGANTQLVDGLVGRGSGNSFEATCLEGPCVTTADRQALLDSAAADTAQISHFTGTYTLGDVTGSGTFNIGGVPEPATWMLLLLGFGGIGAVLRRRRQAAFAG
ncbi:MAG: PEPxxWA-CTERM sorting domain-containing protein [Caulobacterales bacterium]